MISIIECDKDNNTEIMKIEKRKRIQLCDVVNLP